MVIDLVDLAYLIKIFVTTVTSVTPFPIYVYAGAYLFLSIQVNLPI